MTSLTVVSGTPCIVLENLLGCFKKKKKNVDETLRKIWTSLPGGRGKGRWWERHTQESYPSSIRVSGLCVCEWEEKGRKEGRGNKRAGDGMEQQGTFCGTF